MQKLSLLPQKYRAKQIQSATGPAPDPFLLLLYMCYYVYLDIALLLLCTAVARRCYFRPVIQHHQCNAAH